MSRGRTRSRGVPIGARRAARGARRGARWRQCAHRVRRAAATRPRAARRRSPTATSPASATASCAARCSVRSIRRGRTGAQIAIRYVVVPAMARRKFADPVFLLAGGPGQSAIAVAAATMPLFSRLNNRRDIVFVDQRGTGGSAPLACADPEHESLAEQADPERQVPPRGRSARRELLKLPYVRERERPAASSRRRSRCRTSTRCGAQLGAERIDLVGASYGTRVALEYQRQFPQAVRRSVLDGVAPPDMVLPASFSTDNQAAFDALVAACDAEAACAREHPDLRAHCRGAARDRCRERSRPAHPLTGRTEDFMLTRDMLLGAVRSALYAPALAAALPAAIDAAARGEFAGLVGLNATFSVAQGDAARDRHALLGRLRRGRAAPAPRRATGRARTSAPTSRASTSGCARTGRAARCRRRSTAIGDERGAGAGAERRASTRRRRRATASASFARSGRWRATSSCQRRPRRARRSAACATSSSASSTRRATATRLPSTRRCASEPAAAAGVPAGRRRGGVSAASGALR